jgi:hypothetical protein
MALLTQTENTQQTDHSKAVAAERLDLSGRRPAGVFYISIPIHVFNADNQQVAVCRSPRKFAKAITTGQLNLIAGDLVYVGRMT